MLPRHRVYAWVGPLIFLSWLSLALMRLDPGNGIVAIGYFLGSLLAHPTLAAVWTALGSGPLAWRVALSIGWVISLPVAVAINIAINGRLGSALPVLGVCVISQWLVLQIPLWLLKLGFGLQLRYRDDIDAETNSIQFRFGMWHLLVVMAIAGVLLGVGVGGMIPTPRSRISKLQMMN